MLMNYSMNYSKRRFIHIFLQGIKMLHKRAVNSVVHGDSICNETDFSCVTIEQSSGRYWIYDEVQA